MGLGNGKAQEGRASAGEHETTKSPGPQIGSLLATLVAPERPVIDNAQESPTPLAFLARGRAPAR